MNKCVVLLIIGLTAFLLALVLTLLLTAQTAKAQNLQGTFTGKLDAGITKLTIVLNVLPDGSTSLESPDQTDQKIPTVTDFLSADSVAVSAPALQVAYSARLTGSELQGHFTQGGMTFPLTLKAGEMVRRRPQTPTAACQHKELHQGIRGAEPPVPALSDGNAC